MSFVLPAWPEQADEGVRRLARGDFLGAATCFEAPWEAAEGHAKRFWQGLAQIAGGLSKIEAGAPPEGGAIRLLENGHRKLAGVLPVGAPVHALAFAEEVARYLEARRHGRPATVPRLWRRGEDGRPGLVVADWPAEAADGVRLFDAGDYWEAHERFETVMEAAPGETGLFFKALIQAGSALLKAGRGQPRPAAVLAGTSARLLDWLAPIALPDAARIHLEPVRAALAAVLDAGGAPDPVPAPRLATD